MEKSCWTCGHWLIGGFCFKNGTDKQHENTSHDYVCNKWVAEDIEGTITGMIAENAKEENYIYKNRN